MAEVTIHAQTPHRTWKYSQVSRMQLKYSYHAPTGKILTSRAWIGNARKCTFTSGNTRQTALTELSDSAAGVRSELTECETSLRAVTGGHHEPSLLSTLRPGLPQKLLERVLFNLVQAVAAGRSVRLRRYIRCACGGTLKLLGQIAVLRPQRKHVAWYRCQGCGVEVVKEFRKEHKV